MRPSPAILALAAALAGCGQGASPPPAATTGFLEVSVGGLPPGVPADATVDGPSAASQHLTAAQTLSGLLPGSYTVAAQSVSSGGKTYTATVAGSPASVVAGGTASASVTYAASGPTTGSLTITTTGGGSPAPTHVSVSGPAGYAATLTQTPQTLTGLQPGSYTVTAAGFSNVVNTFAAVVTGSPASVVAGQTASVAVAYSVVVPVPTVTSVVGPAGAVPSGSVTGGYTVTIKGTNFVSGQTSVSFGGTAGTGVLFSSATQISVSAPAHALGVVDVLVSTPGGTSAATATDKFRYWQATYYPITPGAQDGSLVSGPDGNLWFAERVKGRIGRITLAGVVTEYDLPHADSTTLDLAVGPDGNLWYGSAYPVIGRITPAGATTEFAIPSGCNTWGVTPGPGTTVWFTEHCTGVSKVGYIDTASPSVIHEYDLDNINALGWGIAKGPDGKLWFAEAAGKRIGVATPAGSISYHAAGANQLDWVTFGPDGNLWFSQVGQTLGVVSPAFTFTEHHLFSSTPFTTRVAADPQGALWYGTYNSIGVVDATSFANEEYFPDFIQSASGMVVGSDGALWALVGYSMGLGGSAVLRFVR